LFSENIVNSAVIAVVAIVGPILFFYVMMRIPERIFMNNEILIQVITGSIICFLLIGIMMYSNSAQNVDVINDAAINRTGGGLWLSNVSTQVLALLFPFVFLKIDYKYAGAMKITALILFVVLLSISMSRTGLIVYIIMILLIFRKSKKKFLFLSLGIPLLVLTLYYLKETFKVDIIDLYATRFFGDGSVLDRTAGDSRFQIYSEAFKAVGGREFLGTGISTFNDLNSGEFSNAHNIFINIFVERGLIGLGLVLFLFYFMFKINVNSSSHRVATNQSDFFILMKIGLLGFLLIGLTGNDLFLNSGFINGWPAYIIVFLLVIVLKKRSYLLKVKESV
jgi:O-antigen ligase